MTREVEKRIEDLTHQIHREILGRSVEQVKTLAPILICSMKIFIQIISQGPYYFFEPILYIKLLFYVYNELETYCLLCSIVGAKGGEEAAENRNYLASRMTEEVTEMIRVLQVMNL